MIVSFTTAAGSKFHLDHTNKMWVQEVPTLRNGPLYNLPSVRVGRPVEIQTEDPTGKTPLKIIITAPVTERDIRLEVNVA